MDADSGGKDENPHLAPDPQQVRQLQEDYLSRRRPIILIGPMAAGKSYIGTHLAKFYGYRFVDADEYFVQRYGPISDFFDEHGEREFRRLEAQIVREILESPAHRNTVLSLGGGAPMTDAVAQLLRGECVIYIRVDAETVRPRIEGNRSRPLLQPDPMSRWLEVTAPRLSRYRELASYTLDARGGRSLTQMTSELQQFILSTRKASTVNSMSTDAISIAVRGERPSENYDVVVGHHLLGLLPDILGGATRKVLVIHPRALRSTGELVMDDLRKAGYESLSAEIPDAEEGKHLQVAGFCWQVLGQNNFTRTDAVVSVGGGAVSDLAGFVASTWLRGVKVVHMPTTLLGMVDAAVGGKTAINTAEGKNLVGTFYPPAAVLCEIGTLRTLPRYELLTGMAEVIKCGFIADPEILRIIEGNPEKIRDSQSDLVRELIERSVRVKADIVSDDLRESGRREFLNYGHTLAHAIERLERYRWRHGAAVAVGMVYAAELSLAAGYLDEETVDRTRAICESVGLPTTYPAHRWGQLLETMRRDKKARGNQLRFVILDRLAQPRIYEVPDEAILFSTYLSVADPAE